MSACRSRTVSLQSLQIPSCAWRAQAGGEITGLEQLVQVGIIGVERLSFVLAAFKKGNPIQEGNPLSADERLYSNDHIVRVRVRRHGDNPFSDKPL